MAQAIGVVAVLVAGRNHQHAEPQDLGHAVPDPLGQARIVDAGGQTFGQAEPALNLAQGQQPAVRGEQAAIEAGNNGLASGR